MFGRRKQPLGGSEPPPPPGGKEPFPIEKMDRALEAAIRLFTRVLDDAGVDVGGLAIRGPVPENVTALLANCTTYRDEPDGRLTYLALGITADFKAFMYPPHCRLFFIINSTGICEDPHAATILRDLAPVQLPGPLVDAHFMRRWIRFILLTPEALRGGAPAIEALHHSLMEELMAVVRLVPSQLAEGLDLKERWKEWSAGLPGTISRPLDDSVPRMNGLPVTPFIEQTLMNELARLQAEGLRQERG